MTKLTVFIDDVQHSCASKGCTITDPSVANEPMTLENGHAYSSLNAFINGANNRYEADDMIFPGWPWSRSTCSLSTLYKGCPIISAKMGDKDVKIKIGYETESGKNMCLFRTEHMSYRYATCRRFW